jgi:hypothetical protein
LSRSGCDRLNQPGKGKGGCWQESMRKRDEKSNNFFVS